MLKPHQLDGVHFLLQKLLQPLQLVQSLPSSTTETVGYRGEPQLGCVLAHSMGLGKTFTAISFLALLELNLREKHTQIVKKAIQLIQKKPASFLVATIPTSKPRRKGAMGTGATSPHQVLSQPHPTSTVTNATWVAAGYPLSEFEFLQHGRRVFHAAPTRLDGDSHVARCRAVVICPKSTISHWAAEFEKWFEIMFDVVQATKSKSVELVDATPAIDTFLRSPFRIIIPSLQSCVTLSKIKETTTPNNSAVWNHQRCVKELHDSGGVLIVGYEEYLSLFRKLEHSPLGGLQHPSEIDSGSGSDDVVVTWKKSALQCYLGTVVRSEIKPGKQTEKKRGERGTTLPYTLATVLKNCDVVILDEAHRFKNSSTALVKNVKAHIAHVPLRIALTGTPLQNNLREYLTLLQVVCGFNHDKSLFQKHYIEPIERGQCIDASARQFKSMQDCVFRLRNFFGGYVHRRGVEILEKDLPKRSEHILFVKLTERQSAVYKALLDVLQQNTVFQALIRSDTSNSLRLSALGFRHIISRLTFHPCLLRTAKKELARLIGHATSKKSAELSELDDGEEKEADEDEDSSSTVPCDIHASFKLLTTIQIVEHVVLTNHEKIVIFSQYLSVLRLLGHVLASRPGLSFVTITGELSQKQRDDSIAKLRREGKHGANVILCTTRVGGVGLSLIPANHCILLDTSWNPSDDTQATFRVFRYGQQRPVFVYRLVSHQTVEHLVLNLALRKVWLHKKIADEIDPMRQEHVSFRRYFTFPVNVGRLAADDDVKLNLMAIPALSDVAPEVLGIAEVVRFQLLLRDNTDEIINDLQQLHSGREERGSAIQEDVIQLSTNGHALDEGVKPLLCEGPNVPEHTFDGVERQLQSNLLLMAQILAGPRRRDQREHIRALCCALTNNSNEETNPHTTYTENWPDMAEFEVFAPLAELLYRGYVEAVDQWISTQLQSNGEYQMYNHWIRQAQLRTMRRTHYSHKCSRLQENSLQRSPYAVLQELGSLSCTILMTECSFQFPHLVWEMMFRCISTKIRFLELGPLVDLHTALLFSEETMRSLFMPSTAASANECTATHVIEKIIRPAVEAHYSRDVPKRETCFQLCWTLPSPLSPLVDLGESTSSLRRLLLDGRRAPPNTVTVLDVAMLLNLPCHRHNNGVLPTTQPVILCKHRCSGSLTLPEMRCAVCSFDAMDALKSNSGFRQALFVSAAHDFFSQNGLFTPVDLDWDDAAIVSSEDLCGLLLRDGATALLSKLPEQLVMLVGVQVGARSFHELHSMFIDYGNILTRSASNIRSTERSSSGMIQPVLREHLFHAIQEQVAHDLNEECNSNNCNRNRNGSHAAAYRRFPESLFLLAMSSYVCDFQALLLRVNKQGDGCPMMDRHYESACKALLSLCWQLVRFEYRAAKQKATADERATSVDRRVVSPSSSPSSKENNPIRGNKKQRSPSIDLPHGPMVHGSVLLRPNSSSDFDSDDLRGVPRRNRSGSLGDIFEDVRCRKRRRRNNAEGFEDGSSGIAFRSDSSPSPPRAVDVLDNGPQIHKGRCRSSGSSTPPPYTAVDRTKKNVVTRDAVLSTNTLPQCLPVTEKPIHHPSPKKIQLNISKLRLVHDVDATKNEVVLDVGAWERAINTVFSTSLSSSPYLHHGSLQPWRMLLRAKNLGELPFRVLGHLMEYYLSHPVVGRPFYCFT